MRLRLVFVFWSSFYGRFVVFFSRFVGWNVYGKVNRVRSGDLRKELNIWRLSGEEIEFKRKYVYRG